MIVKNTPTGAMSREINELSSMISHLQLSESSDKAYEVMNRMLYLMCHHYDLTPLAGEIVKLLALPYPPLKKVICSYLTRYADYISNLNILATNCLLKDFKDPNPYIRKLVIQTVCKISCLHDLAFQLLPKALSDDSSYVRSAAATSCALLLNLSNLDANQDIIDKLYEMIRDPEPSVVSCALAALNEILEHEGGIVVNSRIAGYLINQIPSFHEWDFAQLCMILKQYEPQSSEEVLALLNAIDDKLTCHNMLTFNIALDLALYFITFHNQNLIKDVLQQCLPRLKTLLYTSDSDILFVVLDKVSDYLPELKAIYPSLYKLFLCCFNDTALIKIKKLKMIVNFVNDNNCKEITEEVLLHCKSNIREVAKQAIETFTALLVMHPLARNYIQSFVGLREIRFNNLNEEILKALCSLDLNELPKIKENVLNGLSKHSFRDMTFEGQRALLKMLHNYGTDIPEAPYIIEQIINEENIFESEILCVLALMTTVKLFLIRPPEMQLLLGQFLQLARNSDSLLMRKQSSIYYHLLRHPDKAKKIMQIENQIMNDTENM